MSLSPEKQPGQESRGDSSRLDYQRIIPARAPLADAPEGVARMIRDVYHSNEREEIRALETGILEAFRSSTPNINELENIFLGASLIITETHPLQESNLTKICEILNDSFNNVLPSLSHISESVLITLALSCATRLDRLCNDNSISKHSELISQLIELSTHALQFVRDIPDDLQVKLSAVGSRVVGPSIRQFSNPESSMNITILRPIEEFCKLGITLKTPSLDETFRDLVNEMFLLTEINLEGDIIDLVEEEDEVAENASTDEDDASDFTSECEELLLLALSALSKCQDCVRQKQLWEAILDSDFSKYELSIDVSEMRHVALLGLYELEGSLCARQIAAFCEENLENQDRSWLDTCLEILSSYSCSVQAFTGVFAMLEGEQAILLYRELTDYLKATPEHIQPHEVIRLCLQRLNTAYKIAAPTS
jgi:hypothetical protein